MKKFSDFFLSKDTPRYWLLIGGVLTLLASIGGNTYTNRVNLQNIHRVERIDSLVNSMFDFQIYATAFSLEMAEERAVQLETQANLIENLNEQYNQLERVRSIVSPNAQRELDNYRKLVLEMNEVTRETQTFMSMREFYGTASKLTKSRKKLHKTLKSEI